MAAPIYQQPGPPLGLPHVAAAEPSYASGPVTIRHMTPNDATFVGRMAVDAFRGKFEWAAGKRNIEGCMKAQAVAFGSMDEEQMSRVFIAEYQGQPAGMVALKFHGNKLLCMSCVISGENVSAGLCYIDHICVDSQFRGKGIGKALMDRADHEARMRQCRAMTLYVARDNRAVNLYQRQGYRIVENEDGWLCTWIAVGIRKWYRMEKTL